MTTNRDIVNNTIKVCASQRLREELDYFIECSEEYIDDADALTYVEDHAESCSSRGLITDIREVLIKAGGYQKAPEKTCTGRDIRFTHLGIKYDWPHTGYDVWLEQDI